MPLSSGILALVVFISRFGCYRVILFLSIYFIVDAAMAYFKPSFRVFEKLYVPGLVITMYLDIKYGPLLRMIIPINVFIVTAAFYIIELLINKHIKQLVELSTGYSLFTLCPNCGYENKYLDMRCSNCEYSSGQRPYKPARVPAMNSFAGQSAADVLISIKLGWLTGNSVKKNANRIQLTSMNITRTHMILLNKYPFHRGWSYKETVKLADIASLEILSSSHYGRSMPILKVSTQDNYYEVYIVSLVSNMPVLSKIYDVIMSHRNNNGQSLQSE